MADVSLDLRHRYLSGRQFEEDDQAAFARPVRGPVLEDCGVKCNAVHRSFRRAARAALQESAMANGAL